MLCRALVAGYEENPCMYTDGKTTMYFKGYTHTHTQTYYLCVYTYTHIYTNLWYNLKLTNFVSFRTESTGLTLWMNLLPLYDFVTSDFGHLKNTDSLGFVSLPNVDIFHCIISKTYIH